MQEDRKIRFLTAAIVEAIQADQIRLYGGLYGVRDGGLLESAINAPRAQFAGEFLHPTIFHMAAAYSFSISQNQPFVDGNKRTAGMAMLTFLKLNGLEPICSDEDYYQAMMAVATRQMTQDQLAEWLKTEVNGSVT